FCVNLTKDIADKTTLVFSARSKWRQPDPFEPGSYVVEFQITGMASSDHAIFHRMSEKYGTKK
ncbi:MAG: hypothetical protein PHQ36_07040, partial [Anaerolineales bacterium]|nr:hypothetical protein [Anaerolineales bacterium]